MDPNAGEQLRDYARDWSIWVVDSDANRPVVEALWAELSWDRLQALAVTIGDRKVQLPDRREDFARMLGDVVVHFPEMTTLGVVGLDIDDLAASDSVIAAKGFYRAADSSGLVTYRRQSD
jgi:hypothetical protein